ncbi:MAG: UbiD family decarboxylase [Geobacteraceae bacterium]|nr:UbiD family decarboxylase [Geobacteraceae bacterium]
MAYRCLQEFLARLEEMGELCRVKVEVDPLLEISEITDRVCKSPHGGKALLFERVRGSAFPVATNLFGSYRRVCAALEISELGLLSRTMEELLPQQPASHGEMEDLLDTAFSGFFPLLTETGDCQEVADHDPDLGQYPFLKSWPGDAGRFITLPLVFTRDPETGAQNCGMYRIRIFDAKSAGVHWSAGSGGAVHYGKYRSLGKERMPIAIALGGDPALTWSASLPLPGTVDEMAFAGYMRKEPVAMVRTLTAGIMVPAGAEMVIEGYLEPGEMREEGAFGNHTGHYTTAGEVPVVHVTCITRRSGMIYPATVVGRPPMEDCYMAKAAERLFLPLSRRQAPAVVDINLPMEGIFHGCAVVSIRKERAGQGMEVMRELWRTGWLRKAKMLVVVDADVPVDDLSLVGWKVVNNAEWPRNLLVADGRMGVDATCKLAEETCGVPHREISRDAFISDLVERKWREYGCA